jgi:hypothetical protein
MGGRVPLMLLDEMIKYWLTDQFIGSYVSECLGGGPGPKD